MEAGKERMIGGNRVEYYRRYLKGRPVDRHGWAARAKKEGWKQKPKGSKGRIGNKGE
jgi:hypothetical protein